MLRFNVSKRIFTLLLCLAVTAAAFCLPTLSVSAAEDAVTVPRIVITTAGGNGTALQKDDIWRDASITITGTDGSILSNSCVMKVRGNTTALSWVTKKSYSFKFDKKRDVLGMGKGKKWALNANVFDPTLLRNYTAFAFAKELGLAYTSEVQFVELWLDGVFCGCYLLEEPVQQGKDRVDIDVESNDGKQDFLLEYEKSRVEDDEVYLTTNSLRFIISEPENATEEQQDYIKKTMQTIFYYIRYGTRAQIEEVVDVDSFAKFYLLNEYMKTYDLDMSSVYFYYKDGKLYAGPPWDYDMSMGNSSPDFPTTVAKEAHKSDGVFAADKTIFRYICQNKWFFDEVKRVYRDHFDFMQHIAADGGLLDAALAQYGEVFDRNYGEAGWSAKKWWINYQLKPQDTYEGNFNFLKTWGQERAAWMEQYYDPFDVMFLCGDADGDGEVTISDVTMVQRCLAELVPADEALLQRADVTGGGLTVDDATAIQRYLAEFDGEYGIGTKVRKENPAS